MELKLELEFEAPDMFDEFTKLELLVLFELETEG